MDAVSHAIIGRLLTRAAATEVPRRAITGAAILGALSPDVDFVLMPVGWDIYLRFHEVGTHSVVGALATGLGSAWLIRAGVRGSRYRPLAVAAVAGAFSHLLSDVAAGATLRPGWPFLNTATSVPLVAMADPWTIAILLAAALAVWWRPEGARGHARAGLLALAAFLSLKGALLAVTLARPAGVTALASTSDRVIEARWASLTEWYVFGRTGDVLTQWRLDARGTPPALLLTVSSEESDTIAASRALDTVRNFLRVHRLGFAVHREHEEDGALVLWSDIRFCWKDPLPAAAVQCALWFGGVVDDRGAFVRQEVRVGSWTQTRPISD